MAAQAAVHQFSEVLSGSSQLAKKSQSFVRLQQLADVIMRLSLRVQPIAEKSVPKPVFSKRAKFSV